MSRLVPAAGTALLALLVLASCSPRRPDVGALPVPATLTAARGGELRIAELGSCTLESGETIDACRVAYRTFGTLDAARSNLVLVPTWFTGTTASLLDVVPDRLVDTRRSFVVLVDSLGDGVSSSPSTSRTQPRLRFPAFTVHDMVEAQRRLVREVFGVTRLRAVAGISMGGMQAFEWAVAHPDEVERFVSLVGTPRLTSHDLLLWSAELAILDGSEAYAGGEYPLPQPPIPALQAVHWMMLSTPELRNEETSRAAFPAWLAEKARDTSFDWNDWRRQAEAMMAHDVSRATGGDLAAAARRVKAKGLVVVAERDQVVSPGPAMEFARVSGARLVVLSGPCGHSATSCDATLAPTVKRFLDE